MSTFTVYCHGTGFNRVKGSESDELVAWFHNHTDGGEAQLSGSAATPGSYMINEGPGHGGNEIAQPQNVNPITGAAKVDHTVFKRLNPFSSPSFKDHARGDIGGPKNFAGVRGKISGQGWDENVIRTVNLIQDLKFDKGQHIDRVNMVGWSRGAVTCIRIAHRMHEIFDNSIECNIFAVDPVAGSDAGLEMDDTRALLPNVKRYLSILSMHEMRKTFKPQDWSRLAVDPSATTAVMLPMPGVHNAQVMVNTPPDSAYITRNLACAFLLNLGTSVSSVPYGHLGSPLDMCVAYSRLVLSLSEHRQYQSQGVGDRVVGTGLRRRDFAKHSKMDTYTRGGKESYWINEHHRACFAAAFPEVYNFVFESKSSGEMAVTARSRFSGFHKALSSLSPLRNSLIAKGLLAGGDGGAYWIDNGAGRYSNQIRQAWPDEFPLCA
jgi:hypothetical protein